MTTLTDSERLVAVEVKVEAIHEDLHAIWSKVGGRPSWATTIVLTLLSSLVVGLAVALGAQLGT